MKKNPIIYTPSGPCTKDCEGRSETCHFDCPKYLKYKDELNEFKERKRQDRSRYDTMSEDSKRKMWRDSRYSRNLRTNKGQIER